jgi:hypothetical protein
MTAKIPPGLKALQSLGWLCPHCDGAVGPVRTIPANPTPNGVLTCTIVCANGHEIKGEKQ